MSKKYHAFHDALARRIAPRNEAQYNVLTCVYHEHLLYSTQDTVDALHDAQFCYAHYIAFKRRRWSLMRSRVRNRCAFSGRSRAVNSSLRMSRFVYKMLARAGYLNGIRKSSW